MLGAGLHLGGLQLHGRFGHVVEAAIHRLRGTEQHLVGLLQAAQRAGNRGCAGDRGHARSLAGGGIFLNPFKVMPL